jgi:hypothetical protein
MALNFPDAPTVGQYFPQPPAANTPVWQWNGTTWTWTGWGNALTGVIPENLQTANYTLVAQDAGKFIYHPLSDNNARTFTIPANASVAYTIGTVISFVNLINTVTIAITTDTMYLAGPGTTGSRTLSAYGCCTALKVDTTTWIISGTGLT